MFFNLSTKIYHEKNCVKNHANEICNVGSKAFIITGKNSSRKNGSLDDIKNVLEQGNIDYIIFDDIEENPSVETVIAASKIGYEENVDFVIGVGGGSAMDASKAIAIMIKNNMSDADILYKNIVNIDFLPVVAVPTTCGTGSEVTGASVLTLHKQHTKKAISHSIYPVIALVDSRYLYNMPINIIRNTSMDALAHLVESFLNKKSDVYNRMCSEKGLSVFKECRESLASGIFDEFVFDKLMNVSVMAGMSIRYTGTSVPHGLSYRVTYECGMPHGKACAIFLPGFIDLAPNQEKRHIFELTGFTDTDDFRRFILSLYDDTDISEEILEYTIQDMINNKPKLNSAIYEVNEEILRKIAYAHC